MKTSLKVLGFKTRNAIYKYGPAALMTTLICEPSFSNVVLADTATELASLIIGIIAKLIIALGVFISLLGTVNFASAHSEGNGGAQDKAVK